MTDKTEVKGPYEIAQEKMAKRLAAQRKVIADLAAGENTSADQISRATHVLASIEGESLIDLIAASTGTAESKRAMVLGYLTRGADDTWSGRSNDLARSKYDGLRKAAENFLRPYLYQ